MFDNYTLKARLYPVIILFFPLVVLGIFYSIEFKNILHFLSSVGVVGALTYLFSQLGRDRGKKLEQLLWQSWGGAPSIQLMRFGNQTIDKYTKSRYHSKLLHLCSVPVHPDEVMERNNPSEADEIYKTWTKFLITKTRDESAFPLLFKENTSYGFRRNLWGLKPFGICLVCIVIISNYFFWCYKLDVFNPIKFSNIFFYTAVVLGLILIFWITVVRKDWIKLPAFSYAERLLESVESM
ncbi:hypothetical protein [Rufibacter sp. LB8]|uniref:hypothetical protein n=1 Tax=Rufibacter sp. LB8 TaxID=2777781 RepID=UPI00178C3571|nr:hypothetical protein [Rufibacter sp. LB8]